MWSWWAPASTFAGMPASASRAAKAAVSPTSSNEDSAVERQPGRLELGREAGRDAIVAREHDGHALPLPDPGAGAGRRLRTVGQRHHDEDARLAQDVEGRENCGQIVSHDLRA